MLWAEGSQLSQRSNTREVKAEHVCGSGVIKESEASSEGGREANHQEHFSHGDQMSQVAWYNCVS